MSSTTDPADLWLTRMGVAPLSDEERSATAELAEVIQREMAKSDGCISFRHFMEMALYTPGTGYYTGGRHKFGSAGDFVTAPEISPLFARCIARQVAQVFGQIDGAAVLEFGAGSGRLAVDLLQALDELGSLPEQYLILEVSPSLRARQEQRVRESLPPALAQRVEWLEHLPTRLSGVILANEVVDAMPVHRFRMREGAVEESFVSSGSAGFEEVWRSAPTDTLQGVIDTLGEPLPEGYISEINLMAEAWIRTLAELMERGVLLVIDYGHTRAEYYHPERSSGTLLCHFRHRAHQEWLRIPGLQDITAHVDFTGLASAAVTSGLDVLGYTTQGNFLINSGLDELLHALSGERSDAFIQQIQQVKTLTLPSQMGERFKVIALGKGVESELIGFSRSDLRHRL